MPTFTWPRTLIFSSGFSDKPKPASAEAQVLKDIISDWRIGRDLNQETAKIIVVLEKTPRIEWESNFELKLAS